MSKNPNWTRDEHVLAFKLYNEIPFGQIDEDTPAIQALAKLIGRTPGAVSIKLANLARFDPVLQARGIKGMSNGAKGEAAIWEEFAAHPEALALECERILAKRLGKPLEETAGIKTDDLPAVGVEREAVVRLRVNQNFFRKRVLSAYDFRCCVTGLGIRSLLTASHIVPWAEDPANRLNPKNGLCLNALHDRAFDRHLMWVDPDLNIRFSSELLKPASGPAKEASEWLVRYEGRRLLLPRKFCPGAAFLQTHASRCKALAKN